jgi:MOSC domain-containing protein YiiM
MGSVPRLEAVCVTAALKPEPTNPGGLTGIDKSPVNGPVVLGRSGVGGDRVMDSRNHGGPDKAAYAYAREDAAWWAAELGRDVPPGMFGENLATVGIDVTGAVLGERWRIGAEDAVVVEVVQPRVPCATFQRHTGEQHWVKRFTLHGAPGAYLRVVHEGAVRAGDPVEVVSRPAHGITIGDVFADRLEQDQMRRLLAEPDLAESLRAELERRLRRRRAG